MQAIETGNGKISLKGTVKKELVQHDSGLHTHTAYVLSEKQNDVLFFWLKLRNKSSGQLRNCRNQTEFGRDSPERKPCHLLGISNILKGYRNLDTSI